ncbi:TIGR01440 family protein [Deltaproteobacteria bacterium Smac51]|nr:TIGR01440 family protein [Deltaproteobacteria bacterium Smac51]
MNSDIAAIKSGLHTAINEFLQESKIRAGQIVVLGCSTSEVGGRQIGQCSNQAYGEAIIASILPVLKERGIYLAVQCCEHLNRALVIEEEAAEKYNFEEVTVIPVINAGGAAATAAYRAFCRPVVVEKVAAHGGLDIGDTEIGMHVIPVQVPVRLSIKKVGQAALTCLKRRPKFIGGSRAQYEAPSLSTDSDQDWG